MATISKTGIATGQNITADHTLNIIEALDGTDTTDINIKGTLTLPDISDVSASLATALASSGGSFTAAGISGSLGTNATLIRSLTAASITGSSNAASSSFSTRVSTNETNVTTNTTNITSLTTVTGSYAITGSNTFTGDQNISGNISASGDITSSGFISGRQKVHIISNAEGALNDFALSSSVYLPNTLFSINPSTSGNAVNVILPSNYSEIAGLTYDFIITATAGSGVTFTIEATSAVLNGIAICDDGTEDIVGTQFTFGTSKAIKGTKIHTITDGNIWHITAFCLCNVGDVSTV